MSMKLIFLRGGGYFFDSSVKTYWSDGLDPHVAALLKGQDPGEFGVQKLYHIELAGEHGYIGYRDRRGKPRKWQHLNSMYPKLAKWIDGDETHHGDKIRISLGPHGQFFAFSNRGYRWHSLSHQFHDEIQNMMAGDDEGPGWRAGYKPSGAAFGINSSFLIFSEGGQHIALSENFKSCYPTLDTELRDRFKAARTTSGVYDYIAINPYEANQYLAVWSDHTVSWKLPPAFLAMLGAALEWFGATSDEATRAQLRDAIAADTPASGASTPRSSFSSGTTLPRAARSQSAQGPPRPQAQPYWSHQTGWVPQAAPSPRPTPRPPLTHGYTSPLPSTHNNRPSSFYPGYAPSAPSHPPQAPFNTWVNTQDASTKHFLTAARMWGRYWNHYAQNAGNMNSFGGNGFGGSGGFNSGPMSMFNSNPFSGSTMFGGDPTGGFLSNSSAGFGGDPTGGLLTGGALPIDPSSMLGGFGMDPVSLMSGTMGMAGGLQAGCNVM